MAELEEQNPKESEKNIDIKNKLNNSITENNGYQSKKRLRSKTLFAYRDDDSYFQFCDSDDQTDSYLIPNNNLNNSNFFSTVCDKSQWSKINHEINMRPINSEKVCLELDDSIASEILKSLGLDEHDDNLNDAKLSLYNNDNSLINESLNQNISTPVNFNSHRIIDLDENKNTLSSSSLLNQMCPTSNCSSFTEDKRAISNNKINSVKNIPEMEKANMYNINCNNNFADFHAKSVDFTNIPSKLNLTATNGYTKMSNPNNYPIPTVNRNYFPFNISKNNPNYCIPMIFTTEQMNNYQTYLDSSQLNNNYRSLNDDNFLIEKLFMYIRDQNGCRIIQKKIEEKNKEFLDKFYEKIQNNMIEIINDQFGNYVMQKFVECCNKSLITNIINKIKSSLYNIATNTHGTRVLQKILDLITNESDIDLLKDFFQKNFYNLFMDNNGNHVIQKLIYSFNKNKNQFILDEVTKYCVEISKLKLGGCIIQKALENSSENQRKTLIFEIIKNIDKLINDEFGNFIIQHIIFLKLDEYNERIFNFLNNNLVGLSKLKYSSNVIDKCILFEESKYRTMFISKLIASKAIPELIIDQFGNYVIQKALSVCDTLQFMEIISMIKPVIKNLKQTHFGKKIFDNLVLYYGDYFQNKATKNLTFSKKAGK